MALVSASSARAAAIMVMVAAGRNRAAVIRQPGNTARAQSGTKARFLRRGADVLNETLNQQAR